MKAFTVEIVTPDGPVYTSEAEMVIAETVAGEIGILPGHVPTVAPLDIGAIRIKSGKDTEWVAANGGFIEVRPDKVTILSQTSEVAESIDIARAQEALKRAEERLQIKREGVDFRRAELSLKRAVNRIKVYNREM